MTFKLAVQVGPTLVATMAEKFAAVPGVVVTVEGTERVHLEFRTFMTPCVSDRFLSDVRNVHNTTFGLTWRDVLVLGTPMVGLLTLES
jgi:hypothetical protein